MSEMQAKYAHLPVRPPTARQVKEARARYGLTAAEAARLVYVTGDAWFKYEGGRRAMDAARWELFLIKAQGRKPGGGHEKKDDDKARG